MLSSVRLFKLLAVFMVVSLALASLASATRPGRYEPDDDEDDRRGGRGKGDEQCDDDKTLYAFDVACNGNSFRFSGPKRPSGLPDGGANFVVNGYIYPAGTFKKFGISSGVFPNGTAEFPQLVIGTWTCSGWFLNDGMDTKTGAFVATSQIYNFNERDQLPGSRYFTTYGEELIDLNRPFARAITGGTGQYRRFADGKSSVVQTAIATNRGTPNLFNFRFKVVRG